MADLYNVISTFPSIGETDCAMALEPDRYTRSGRRVRSIIGHDKEEITFNELMIIARHSSERFLEVWRELRAEGRGRESMLSYVMVVICLHRALPGLDSAMGVVSELP